MTDLTLIDSYDRRLNYLRVSITDRCNLRCGYCMPAEIFPKLPHREILSYEEILRLVRIGITLGISKVRITGGEPLVRKGVYKFLSALGEMEGLHDISLTTNGVLLKAHLAEIREAGIRRINISLDTLDPEKFAYLTGMDAFHRVWEGIERAIESGFSPIKINTVALRGINEDELVDLARLTFSMPVHVRFIERMPIGNARIRIENPLLAPEIKSRLEALGNLEPVSSGSLDGPAERYRFAGGAGEVGFIRPLSRHFCARCNRLRLTASGELKTCLLSEHRVDLKAPLRSGSPDATLREILIAAVRHKSQGHHLDCEPLSATGARMSSIGG